MQTLAAYFPQGVNPSKTDVRAFFADIFSGAGGALTLAQLLILWRRTITRMERLFATGTGTPGQVLHGLTIACGTGAITITLAQREGKKPMTPDDFLRGFALPNHLA